MSNKKRLTIALATAISTILALPFAASAQEIRIGEPRIAVSEGIVHVSMRIDARKLDMRCNGSLTVIPYIEKEDVRLQLPEVIYSGSIRRRFDERREILSHSEVSAAYKIYPKANRRNPGVLDYSVSIPYAQWMDGAVAGYDILAYACSGYDVAVAETFGSQPVEQECPLWIPDRDVYTAMASFAKASPESYYDPLLGRTVAGKRRSAYTELYITFPQDVPEIISDFDNNLKELRKADSLVNYLASSNMATDIRLTITGHASPEGPLWRNTNLAGYRSQNLYKYLKEKYDMSDMTVELESIPVDWQTLAAMVRASDLPYRSEVLSTIAEVGGDESRERVLSKIGGGVPHAIMLDKMYPRLRRTEMKAEFNAAYISPERAAEILLSHPELLSLDEIYSVAESYPVGSDEHTHIYLRAAELFPGDFTANNNAAAVLLQTGRAEEAGRFIERIVEDERSWMNAAAYYYILGDLSQAAKYLKMAEDKGNADARTHLQKITER